MDCVLSFKGRRGEKEVVNAEGSEESVDQSEVGECGILGESTGRWGWGARNSC